jgi:3-aminobutyryl-CoA ammonia-lyase
LSRYVKRLEQDIGIQLLNRCSDPITLTPAGIYYLEIGRETLSLDQDLKLYIRDMYSSNRATIRVGISPSRAPYILPAIIELFRKQDSETNLEIFELTTDEIKQKLLKNEIDMAAKSMIRMRMSAHDAHYGGNLVDGARMLNLFGDVATELLIIQDGDEGLFCAYDNVEFLAPVYAGDYIEAVGEITHVGNTSRKMVFEARKVIAPRTDVSESAADVLAEPIVVCRASGTCVVPKNCQRNNK